MAVFTSKHFGAIDLENVDECYEIDVEFEGRQIEVDLNFDEEKAAPSPIETVDRAVDAMASYIKAALNQITVDFDAGEESETAREFLEFHLEDFDADEKKAVFGTADEISREQFLGSLEVNRVGFYPEEGEAFMLIDISFREWEEVTNYLLSVAFNAKLEFSEICLES